MSSEQPQSSEQILVWEDDPGAPDSPNSTVSRPRPETEQGPLPTRISGEAPSPGEPGTPDFRYWVAADALRGASDFWGEVCGSNQTWNENVGEVMPIELDAGEDLNAYYDRAGLTFFHGTAGDHVVYSGESGDVVRHEFGHALLDAVQPLLWDAISAEPPALHEAFGDINAILCGLQLQSFREAVLASTGGRIGGSSRLSRVAEQLGWGIRQAYPQAVEPDCLRNASNYFFYRDPLTLPPSAPATSLSSAPHSFSRVFSGGFLSALAGMYTTAGDGEATLQEVSRDAGALLIDAARDTPICVPYFSQFAAHMLAADQKRFGGRYSEAIRLGFVRHGVLALPDATAALAATSPPPRAGMTGSLAAPAPTPAVQPVALSGEVFGFDEHLIVNAPAAPKRFNVSAAAPEGGQVSEPSTEAAAAGYVEDIFRRGHVAVPEELSTGREVAAKSKRASHEVQRVDDSLVLTRRLFKCGWSGCGE